MKLRLPRGSKLRRWRPLLAAIPVIVGPLGAVANTTLRSEAVPRDEPKVAPKAPEVFDTVITVLTEIPSFGSLFRADISKDNPNRLIVCMESSIDSLRRPFLVYTSADGGNTWRETLRDTSTPWMSENSCAFGPGDTAYAVVGASKWYDGQAHHEEGKTHVYRSINGGDSWDLINSEVPFIDWTMAVVDVTKGARRGRLYLPGNLIATGIYTSDGSWLPWKSWAVRRMPLSVSIDGGRTFEMPRFPTTTDEWPKHAGSFPLRSFVMRDGTLVTLFGDGNMWVVDSAKSEPYTVLVSRNGGETIEQHHFPDYGIPTLGQRLGGRLAIDESKRAPGRLYVAYTTIIKGKQPAIALAISNDTARSWKTRIVQKIGEPVERDGWRELPSSIEIAVNRDGDLLLAWRMLNGRVLATVSRDGGTTWSGTTDILPCAADGACASNPPPARYPLNSWPTWLYVLPDSAGAFRFVWQDHLSDGQAAFRTTLVRIPPEQSAGSKP
jgi:hypothetical protein